MPLHQLPPHVVLRPDHPTQKALGLLDGDLRLAWNAKLEHWEIYRPRPTPRGVFWDMLERVTGPDGKGQAEPGEWLIRRLRERDARHNPNAEQKAMEQDEHRLDDVRADVIETYLPLWQRKADPHYHTRDYKDWDKKPVTYVLSRTTKQREAIRAEAK